MSSDPDLAVIGAGPAGIAAAITAARSGARTLLLERQGFVGGIPVQGYLSTLCGLYLCRAEDRGPTMLYRGFPREVAIRLMHLDGVQAPVRMGKTYVLPFRPGSFYALAQQLLSSEPHLRVYCNARFCGADVENRQIQGINVALGERSWQIRPSLVIDASGEALVVRAAGAPLLLADPARQAPALAFPLYGLRGAGISVSKAARWRMLVVRAAEQGLLAPEASWISFLPAVDADCLLLKLNLGPMLQKQPQLSTEQLQAGANQLKFSVVEFLTNNVPELSDCSTLAEESPVLHRTGSRGAGEYILAEQDVLGAAKFPDAAAKGCWPVERWGSNGAVEVRYLSDGHYYEIPKRALQSSTVDNLFMAGKSISADCGAIASARVIGSCLATGEAAALLALKN
ncbi:MAG: FAD-dependent oxidoreductase [Desulfohalobiaceae bacterium]